jgi:hypothetical protein
MLFVVVLWNNVTVSYSVYILPFYTNDSPTINVSFLALSIRYLCDQCLSQ